jgi:carbon storage regulator
MLVLTRKKNQEIMLGNDIKITILEIGEDAIKIGIDAPKNITILRAELYQDVKKENTTAAINDNTTVDLLKDFFAKL